MKGLLDLGLPTEQSLLSIPFLTFLFFLNSRETDYEQNDHVYILNIFIINISICHAIILNEDWR